MRKVLFVGDSRDCFNYGSMATTETLIKMIYDKVGKENVSSIFHRSFISATPIDGWEIPYNEYIKKYSSAGSKRSFRENILNKLDNTVILTLYKELKRVYKLKRGKSTGFNIDKYHVPYKFQDFESFAEKVKAGECLQYEKKMIESADIVIINGEGSIVSGTDSNGYYHVSGLYPIYIAYLAKHIFGKPCYIINHTVDPQNRDIMFMIKNVYPELDGVYIREPLSAKILDKCGVTNYEVIPDALFAYEEKEWQPSEYIKNTVDFSKPYICLGDTSGFYIDKRNIWDIEKTYEKLVDELRKICPQVIYIYGFGKDYPPLTKVIDKKKLPYVSINNTTYEDLYHILKHAEIFISGRWHTSILSLLAETPILLFGSDSHKTEALYEMIDYPYRFFDYRTIPLNIDYIVEEAKKIIRSDNSRYFELVKQYSVKARENVKML